MSEQNIVSKISVAKVHGKIDMKALPKGTIFRIVGIARGTKTGVTNFGQWEALTGTFVAYNLLTGEEFRSGVCFMPQTAIDLVTGALADSPDGVEFALDIGVKPSSREPETKYEYTLHPVLKPKDTDAMGALLAKANEAKPLALTDETAAPASGKKGK